MKKTQGNEGCQVRLAIGLPVLGLAAGGLCWALGGSVQQAVGVAALVTMAPFLLASILLALLGTILALAGALVATVAGAGAVKTSVINKVADRAATRRNRKVQETYKGD